MGSWAYGLVEEDGDLKLCEVYLLGESEEDIGFYNLNWKDINEESLEVIKKDVCDQLDAVVNGKVEKFKWVVKE
jgi:hypothetical protein